MPPPAGLRPDCQRPLKSTVPSICKKCLRALQWCRGVVRQVSGPGDPGCEGAGRRRGTGLRKAGQRAASVAGAKLLVEEWRDLARRAASVCILTGHELKDPTATVAYHTHDAKYFDEVLRSRGVEHARFANRRAGEERFGRDRESGGRRKANRTLTRSASEAIRVSDSGLF